MTTLTVRLTDDEERLLEKRSKAAVMTKEAFVRQLIREQPFEAGADVLVDASHRMGDVRLRVVRSGTRFR